MLKTDPKKVPSQKYVFASSSRYNDLTFYEKKFPLHNPFKKTIFFGFPGEMKKIIE